MTRQQRTDNLANLARSIRGCRIPGDLCPSAIRLHHQIPNSDLIAKRVSMLPDSAWHLWETDPPSISDGEIVGRDVNGYYYLATHLIAGTDRMWADYWISISSEIENSIEEERKGENGTHRRTSD